MPPSCPHCRSLNILPFEEEGRGQGDQTFVVIFLSAFALLAAYFVFLMFSYINYPLMVILFIIFISIVLRQKEKRESSRKKKEVEKEFICLDCNATFPLKILQ
jgi:Flp pilus assembly protein TadB